MSSFQGYSATKVQVAELFEILSIMRPHGSDMEEKFIKHYLLPLNPEVDKGGNLIVKVGKSTTMWSCHIDTVHSFGGIAPIMLGEDGIIKLHPKSRANCLGADDGAGVWLMLQMIRANRPGMYVFHRGEERGCIGSKWIAKNTPKMLEGIQAAIAFDRKDVGSIITHQMGSRCCSEDFSKSLADAIGMNMKSDNGGSFTDTASYTDLIGECTNVSVGYRSQHGKTEEQDMRFLLSLMDHMLEVDERDFVYKRKPGEREKRSYGYGRSSWAWGGEEYYSGHHYGPKLRWEQGKEWSKEEQGYIYLDKDWDEKKGIWVTRDKTKSNKRTYMDTRFKVFRKLPLGTLIPETYLRIVKDFPEEIALLLEDKGYGMGFLHDQVRKHGGVIITHYEDVKPHDKKKTNIHLCERCQRLKAYCCCT